MLQLLHIMEEWAAALENGGQINTIYTDFILILKKTFDKVHHLLLKKLQSYNLNVNVVQWIRSFLCYRKQRVKINGCYSGWADVISGIPQGTILGPILFIIYINDSFMYIINRIGLKTTYQKFVNDLPVSIFLQTMQSCLSMSSVTKIIKLCS